MNSVNAPSQFTVAIQPLGDIPERQIEFTKEVLEREFGVKTVALAPKEIPAAYFNADRNRYRLDKLLDNLFFRLPKDAQRIIGVVDGLLENKSQGRVFGGALAHHRVAVYGSSVIPNQIDQKIFFYPIIMHEFGHTLGLLHCTRPNCAMNSPRPSIELCTYCRRWADRELKVKFGSAEERFSLAESYFWHNCLPQAIATYREAIACAPQPEPLYYNRLSEALYRLEQHDEVEKSLSLAMEYSDDEEHFFYNFGLIYIRKDPKQAEEYFAKAIDTAKDPQKLQRLVGQAYREITHDVERASRHYKQFLQLGGNDQDVIDWLVSRSRMDQA